jgi:hypothetical protein
METNTAYDFPVSLRPVFTEDNFEVPKVKAVVRGDTKKPIAAVSDRYHLIEHREVLERASDFISQFGTPTVNLSIGSNGAVLVGEYTYRDNIKEVALNDVVGLRVYMENSYNKMKSLRFRIGGLRLKCLNGMVAAKDIFDLCFRHMKGQVISFPTKEEVLASFRVSTRKWEGLAQAELSQPEYKIFAEQLVNIEGLMPKGFLDKGLFTEEADKLTAWGLYNDATRFITHVSKASDIGKVNRLARVDEWFGRTFH